MGHKAIKPSLNDKRIYRLMGTFQGKTEEIDSNLRSLIYAKYMQCEYELSFGPGWSIVLKRQRN